MERSPEAIEAARVLGLRAGFWATVRVVRRVSLRSVAGRVGIALALCLGLYTAAWTAFGGLLGRRALNGAGVLVGLVAAAPLAIRVARGSAARALRETGIEAAAAARGTRGSGVWQAAWLGVLAAMGLTIAFGLAPPFVALLAKGIHSPARVLLTAALAIPFCFAVAGLCTSLAFLARSLAHPHGTLGLVTLVAGSIVLGGLVGTPSLALPSAVRALWALVLDVGLGVDAR